MVGCFKGRTLPLGWNRNAHHWVTETASARICNPVSQSHRERCSLMRLTSSASAGRILLAVIAVMLGAAASPGLAASSGATSRTSGAGGFELGQSATRLSGITNCAWSVVKSPSGSGGSILDSVAAVSPTDVWAVGASNTVSGIVRTFSPHALIEHFDGKRWSILHGPGGRYADSDLTGVSATSDGNVWVVGWGLGDRGYYFIVIEHYNGHRWLVSNPQHPPQSTLSSVTALSADDVWAVGSSDKVGLFAEHFNGKKWSLWGRNSSPVPGQVNIEDNAPTAVSAAASNDVWIAGQYLGGKANPGSHTLTEHYNGKRWALVKSPNPSDTGSGVLLAVSAPAVGDVWAVGLDSAADRPGSRWATRPLVERYAGGHWSIAAAPHLRRHPWSASLNGVAPLSQDDVWAVGSRPEQALIEHFNGRKWQVVSTPSLLGTSSLTAITAISSTDLWAVGSGPRGTLIEHYGGGCS
jgi:hypothetical protein